jgi:drug/metabolite transporter (DMT)-like permease
MVSVMTAAATTEQSAGSRPLLWLALGTIYVVWGSTYLGIRIMVETVPPLLGAGVRFALAGTLFLLVLLVRGGRARVCVGRRELLGAAGVGLLLVFGGNGLVTVAERTVPSALAALLIASVPLWVVVFRLLDGDRPGAPTLVGVAVGFVGVALLLRPGGATGEVAAWGLALMVVAATSWAAGSYYSVRFPLPADALLATALQMLIAGSFMIVLGLVLGERVRWEAIAPRSALAFAYLVVAGSLLAFTAYVWLLRNAPISLVATYAYVNPVVAILLGWVVLSEEITPGMLVGAAVVVASVALVVTRGSARARG